MEKIVKILVTKHGRKFYAKDLNKDLHTQYGFVKAADLKKAKDGAMLKSNTGEEFLVISPSFIDNFRKIKRGPQIIPSKDVGLIIAETGLGSKSKVLDSGTGSGALACTLANIAKEVVSYEIREDFFKIAKENADFLELTNLKIKNQSVYDGIDEKGFDVIVFDLPEPWKAVVNAAKALKIGGFLVNYSPSVPQVMDFKAEIIKDDGLVYLKTVELVEREWEVEDRKVRPKSQGIGHSGFLTFARKVK